MKRPDSHTRKNKSGQQRTPSALEGLLWDEARKDIEMASRGMSPAIGEMQKCFPKEYLATHELVSSMAESFPALALSIRQAEKISEMINSDDEGLTSIQDVLNMQPVNAFTLAHLIKLEHSRRGKKAANKRHDMPGASRAQQAAMREKWASGNFSNRDFCAEQECAGLDIAFSTARKALRNTPAPNPWPAKRVAKKLA